jgi:hypothetical protein
MLESLFALFLMTNLTSQTVQSSSVAPPNNVNIFNIESRTERPSLTENPSIESTSLTESTSIESSSLKEKMYYNYKESDKKSEKGKKDD